MIIIKELQFRIFLNIARKKIAQPDYNTDRLVAMSYEIARWKNRENTASTLGGEKAYCQAMQKIYLRRFNYYLRKGA